MREQVPVAALGAGEERFVLAAGVVVHLAIEVAELVGGEVTRAVDLAAGAAEVGEEGFALAEEAAPGVAEVGEGLGFGGGRAGDAPGVFGGRCAAGGAGTGEVGVRHGARAEYRCGGERRTSTRFALGKRSGYAGARENYTSGALPSLSASGISGAGLCTTRRRRMRRGPTSVAVS